MWTILALCAILSANNLIIPVASQEKTAYQAVHSILVGSQQNDLVLAGGPAEFVAQPSDGKPCVRVSGQQTMIKIQSPLFITPETVLRWSWKKETGRVCILQATLKNTVTNQTRYFGYAAGDWSEPASADPTIEVLVSKELPQSWTPVERRLYDDMRQVLGWESAQITEIYLSPWDGEPGCFANVEIQHAATEDLEVMKQQQELAMLSKTGKGQYQPLPLKNYVDKRVDVFQTSFEECAPGRNSAANEWSAFGLDTGNKDFNAMGREMHVRYPAFDLVFQLYDGENEIKPDTLESFRLGLMENLYPAIWGGWQYDDLLYKVTAMTVPYKENGAADLFKIEVQNPTDQPRVSKLIAGMEGPPDMHLDAENIVRGLSDAPFLIADAPKESPLWLREYGLCDKRAKAYAVGDGPGKTEPAVARYRVGLDGLPIVYRFKSEPGKKYVVCLVTTPHIGGYYLKQPKAIGDLVYEYRVESCEVKTLDYIQYEQAANRPLYVEFTGAADANGDGYIEVSSGVTPDSRIRHTRLSVIYVFPQDLKIVQPESVYSGEMNDQCIWHINVGATPEQDWRNQQYDLSDIGLARLKLSYTDPIAPGEIKTFWLKVPPIHRREPVSMGYIAHAFREVLPGEAVPPFGTEKLAALKALDPAAAEESLKEHWNAFFAKAAKFSTPDSILNDIFLSRLATRAILDTRISQQVYYNPCSPFFYFDHAYRDQAYVVYAYDMAGLHDRAERLLQVYCMDAKDVTVKGPISFDGQPLQLGMLENGLWNTRPGQYDTQGQNIWALVQHYKLSGDRDWLEKTAYPFIKRGAMWIVESRQRHMKEVKDPNDLRYGLIEPGGMEVMEVGKGMHMYYMNGFAILGLSEAADAAQALGLQNDADLFTREGQDLKDCLHRSFTDTFKRTGLYEGHLWFGVEPEGVGMYGFWAHNCLLWPCRCFDPHDPMLSATWRKLEQMSNAWGGGLHSEGAGGFWPYIGADRGISHILRGEPDKALDYFCAFTDTAGGTLSWGEGYNNVIAAGDQPHFWADAQWINLFRHLFVMEDGATLMITPAAFRRWTSGSTPVRVESLPTEFGDLTLRITPDNDAHSVAYSIRITPKGDQAQRSLDKLLLYPRIANGKCIQAVLYNNQPIESFTNDVIVLPKPPRNQAIEVRCILSRDF